MADHTYTVRAEWDEEAATWVAEGEDVLGSGHWGRYLRGAGREAAGDGAGDAGTQRSAVGNGSGDDFILSALDNTGVQSISAVNPAGGSTTAIGMPLGTYGSPVGYQRGFSLAQVHDPARPGQNYAADKTGKECNFRGLTVFGDTLYVKPEFQFQIVEATEDRCVGKTTECPWHKRWKEQGLEMDTCGAGHQAWGDGAADRQPT